MNDLLLITPPATQLNTPYPATPYLTRYLQGQGWRVAQADLGIELVLRVFSRAGMRAVFDHLESRIERDEELAEPAWDALAARGRIEGLVEPVVRFLQGKDRTMAPAIRGGRLLPEGPRLRAARERGDLAGFGSQGQGDAAAFLASLWLEDLADLVAHGVDPGFGFSRYQHHLAVGPVQFSPIAARLGESTLVDTWLDELVDLYLKRHQPRVLGLSVPFPGTLYGALRIGSRAKAAGVYVVMGGGYVSTELREVREDRLFDCVDALVYDGGEGPLSALLDWGTGKGDRRHRTRIRDGLLNQAHPSLPFNPSGTYQGLPLDRYLQVVDSLNPTHRLWSEGRWNKITLAHGCYWKRCAFCDVNLDYIARYEPSRIAELVDRMEALIAETGVSGFHLVDEAAPPRLLRDLALEILRRGLRVQFWGNIRFERAFDGELCRLLAAAGLIAVTGGLEVASDRLLKQMDKGITVAQAARAAQAFQKAGVRVHAYLMFGFPGQTDQETVDAQEVVRQLFQAKLLNSGFWHRFVLTRHSRVYQEPERYGIRIVHPTEAVFALNDLEHEDPAGGNHERFDLGLAASLAAWMRGEALDRPVDSWTRGAPKTRVAPDHIRSFIKEANRDFSDNERLLWIGDSVLESEEGLVVHHSGGPSLLKLKGPLLEWVSDLVSDCAPDAAPLTWLQLKERYPGGWKADNKVGQRLVAELRRIGLIGVG